MQKLGIMAAMGWQDWFTVWRPRQPVLAARFRSLTLGPTSPRRAGAICPTWSVIRSETCRSLGQARQVYTEQDRESKMDIPPQMLLGVERVQDLNGSRKQFLQYVTDPRRAIAHDHRSTRLAETPLGGPAQHSFSEVEMTAGSGGGALAGGRLGCGSPSGQDIQDMRLSEDLISN